ncbi:MAG: DUF4041 domain-containing protein [Clostridia bacterium]|nr:DUF4041 domain-containing protein [Clostridia bacterium]
MGILDIFRIKKFKTEISELITEKEKLIDKVETYESVINVEEREAITIKDLLNKLRIKQANQEETIRVLANDILAKQLKVAELKKEVIVLEDELLYQEFGVYTPIYKFAKSEDYKDKLSQIRQKQKDMIKNKTAATCTTSWTVNGSMREGNKMTNHIIKQVLRGFNSECDSFVENAKFNNFYSLKERIEKSFYTWNRLNEVNAISISRYYLKLKIDELHLAYEYAQKKQEEKEILRQEREILREQAKVAKEIEEKRKELLKEQNHYNNALSRLEEQLTANITEERKKVIEDKIEEVKQHLVDVDVALKDVDYREANQRAGYVYIISNIGAFGENIYKIGMTRRLEPLDRIDELSGASVPFKYDVHALIFSDDAPGLETALHKAFEKQKVNKVNNRKEFFNVSLEEIKKVVSENHDKTVEYIDSPSAQQYRETEMIKKQNQV